ncbi:hypothetical protein [Nonomuraea harbinensis]|uniref:Uncharacterized protein n=1 Tax=Nonomuraea harbinensis TaxID=1286938 RepID=A0ABW1C7R9_9ACTN|nr:hypothetical protein [Nonomuraea harbinensis]
MRLTWKDAVATVAMGVITAVYVVFLQQADVFVLSSVRGATIVILLVGGAGGCAMSRGDLYEGPRTTAKQIFALVATALGVTALAAAAIALIGDSATALGAFFFATAALWLVATLRHAFMPAPQPVRDRDTHEVIR